MGQLWDQDFEELGDPNSIRSGGWFEGREKPPHEGRCGDEQKVCSRCGKGMLYWGGYQGKWRLFDKKGNLHKCKEDTGFDKF